jgi:hypothetical protein
MQQEVQNQAGWSRISSFTRTWPVFTGSWKHLTVMSLLHFHRPTPIEYSESRTVRHLR